MKKWPHLFSKHTWLFEFYRTDVTFERSLTRAVWNEHCFKNILDCVNFFEQTSHSYGFSPVWMRRCFTKSSYCCVFGSNLLNSRFSSRSKCSFSFTFILGFVSISSTKPKSSSTFLVFWFPFNKPLNWLDGRWFCIWPSYSISFHSRWARNSE